MAVGTTLPSGCYLSVASPPSRDADAGLTMFGWFYVPSYAAGQFYTTMMLNYVTNDVGEGFQFEASSSTQSQGFVMCYPPNYTDIGGTYSAGTWYFQAEVYTRSAGVTTRRTYISTTAGATPTLISTQTWTVADASPERFDIGDAVGYSRSLRGTIQYVGLAPVAMSTAELAAQSNSTTPTVSCWVFIAAEEGTYTDSSGNARTVTPTGGTPTAASVGAPLSVPVTSSIAATSGAPTASMSATIDQPSIGASVTATTGAPVAAMSANIEQPALAPRVILYGHSVIEGYGIADPNQHIAPQLKTLLGSRVDTTVVELGYSGETSAQQDTYFTARVSPYVEAGRETIVLFTSMFNSAHAGVSTASIMANVWSICAKARALGCKVVCVSETKADADSQLHEETLLECNALMEANWPTYADGFVGTRERFFDPNNRTLYQEDGAHPTGAGDGVLAQLFYNEVDRILIGASYTQTAEVSTSVGAPTASAAASLTQTLSSEIAASVGAPTASVVAVVGSAVAGTIGATAGAPTASMAVNVTQGISVAIAATAGSPSASMSGVVGTDVDASIGAAAGAPVAGASAWFGDFSIITEVAASAGAPTASARAYMSSPSIPSVSATTDCRRSKQCGERFYVQYIGLADVYGNSLETSAHLHVYANGVQVARLTSADGDITYDQASVSYTASYRQDSPATMRFVWHFPTIEHASQPVEFKVLGPALSEVVTA